MHYFEHLPSHYKLDSTVYIYIYICMYLEELSGLELAEAAEVRCLYYNAMICNLTNFVVGFTADEQAFIFQLITAATHPYHLVFLCAETCHHRMLYGTK